MLARLYAAPNGLGKSFCAAAWKPASGSLQLLDAQDEQEATGDRPPPTGPNIKTCLNINKSARATGRLLT